MIGSQFPAYFDFSSGSLLPVIPRPYSSLLPIERQIADVLRIRTNTIAGRPNIGNLALEFLHRGRRVPAIILRDYLLRTLRSFLPDILFDVKVADGLDGSGFQHFVVEYATA